MDQPPQAMTALRIFIGKTSVAWEEGKEAKASSGLKAFAGRGGSAELGDINFGVIVAACRAAGEVTIGISTVTRVVELVTTSSFESFDFGVVPSD